MKYTFLTFTFLLIAAQTVQAQNELDALRYSQISYGSTALSLGLAGAGGSMGADLNGLSINPASIGVYRSGEASITPAIDFNNVATKYLGNTTDDNKSRFTIRNLGIVFTHAPKGRSYMNSNWKTFSFGIGYNRLADYNQQVSFAGNNYQSSIGEIFAASAQQDGVGSNVTPPLGYLGYEGYILDDNFNSNVPYQDGILQRKKLKTKGGLDEAFLSIGGNYREKLMLGMTIGMQVLHYDKNMTFSEDDISGDPNNNFDYLDYNEHLKTEGIGVNVKLGAIYVVNNYLRIGAAFHTPTWFSMDDTSQYSLQSNTENYKASINAPDTDPYSDADPQMDYAYHYGLRTPWHAVLSATAMLGKYGMLTADYEAIGYNTMHYRMKDAPNYADAVNKAIKNTFTTGQIFRVGLEGNMGHIMPRVGFAYHTSPFKDADLFGGSRYDMSVGLGFRFNHFFMDAAYMHSVYKSSDYAYPALVSGVPTGLADSKFGNNIVALTFGVKL